ncbi:winged helix-turn-helix domain-containing protein [Yokenella regensburgei]|uniref:winged helix-turn-helix domain-containing protein n=1 Tax=Yokenella regensburgei TaxID=158877 RepID=UPI0013763BE2|nr:helix-turn-helix domain-containing protein [Yokenella regensburgei]KAF1366510.1 DNA-binding winged helix-turn-helix (wHTH) protein [Yokenella regensburgei]
MLNKFIFDLENSTITNESENCLFLTKKETRLFYMLINRKSVEISKIEIIKFVWGDVKNYEDNLVQLIYRLRVKLNNFPLGKCILNVHGFGYVFDRIHKISVSKGESKLWEINLQEKDKNNEY